MEEEIPKLTIKDFQKATSNQELQEIIEQKKIPIEKVKKRLFYEKELKNLQI